MKNVGDEEKSQYFTFVYCKKKQSHGFLKQSILTANFFQDKTYNEHTTGPGQNSILLSLILGLISWHQSLSHHYMHLAYSVSN